MATRRNPAREITDSIAELAEALGDPSLVSEAEARAQGYFTAGEYAKARGRSPQTCRIKLEEAATAGIADMILARCGNTKAKWYRLKR